MDCPVCSVSLIVVERQQIELDYCVDCKGLWFDAAGLELLAEALKIEVDMPDIASLPVVSTKEKPRKCPRCAKRMEKVAMGGKPRVVVDRCPRGHGLWFDAGELGGAIGGRVADSDGTDAEEAHVIRFLGEVLAGPGGSGE